MTSHLPVQVSADDPQLQPFLEALSKVDRASMGFTANPVSGDIRIERAPAGTPPGGTYDAMLHISNTPTVGRTIAFQKVGSGYEWINEEEQHVGPRTYKDADDLPQQETLFIIHQTKPLTGGPVNQTFIIYTGEDPRLANPRAPFNSKLTLDEVRPVLAEWATIPSRRR